MKKVLFLCNGNSCRSQMAEAITTAHRGESWQAFSAGTRPAGFVHPKVLAALEEIGIRHEGRSKSMEEYRGKDFDLIMTVCDAAAEKCPVWFGNGKRLHHDYPDPARTGDMDDFRKLRDAMIDEIIPILDSFQPDKS
jgi:arsenate reductase